MAYNQPTEPIDAALGVPPPGQNYYYTLKDGSTRKHHAGRVLRSWIEIDEVNEYKEHVGALTELVLAICRCSSKLFTSCTFWV